MLNIIHHPKILSERRGLKLLLAVKKDLLGYFIKLMQKEGPFAWLSLGGKRVLMLNDAVGIQHVLQDNAKNYHKSHFYKVLRPFLGNSVLLSEGEVWKKQRRESAPVFMNKNFEVMVPQMVEAMQAMLQRWQPRIEKGQPIDLNFETMWFTLDVLLRTLFHEEREGIALGMQSAITTLLREAEERIWAFVSLPQKITFMLPKYKSALSFLDRTLQDLVSARRANQAYPEDLLSRLIDNYNLSSHEQKSLRDQVMTFLLAGHETTANGLVWACYYLSLHPHVMKKMALEADKVLLSGPLNLESIKNLIYTQQVFSEVLRIHPIVWTLSRDAQDMDLIPLEDGSAVQAPKGTVVMMCTYAVHRRNIYWENPEAFNPDRFSGDGPLPKNQRFAYFPFGGGPRQCIGLRFAQIESVIALAMLAHNYELELVPGQNIRHLPNITLRPNGPMLFSLRNRGSAPLPQTEVPVSKNSPARSGKCPFHR